MELTVLFPSGLQTSYGIHSGEIQRSHSTKEGIDLFEFELKKIEDIEPWGAPEKPSLSWFALTDGTFRVEVGERDSIALLT